MIKNVLCDMNGVEVYGVISICLFFTVFTTAMVWAAFQKKSLMTRMSALPLNDGEVAPKGVSHE
jgi:hypothetical protein